MSNGWSRRQFLGRTAAAAAFVGIGGNLLAACGGDDDDSGSGGDGGTAGGVESLAGSPAAPVRLPIYDDNPAIADGLKPETGTLKVFNYPDYVNEEVLAAFEEEYGVSVEVTTFDTDDEAVEKLRTGQVKTDVFLSASYNNLPKLIAAKLVQPMNRSYITNFSSIVPEFQDPFYDQGSQYSVPYTVFGTGIAYRTDRVDPAVIEAKGWEIFWDPTYAGQMSILDDKREGIGLALLRRGITDMNTADKAAIDQATKDLKELTDVANIKVNIEGYKDVPEGNTTIAHAWSGDPIAGVASYLPEGTDASVVGWWYPADRKSVVNNDLMLVLKGAEKPVLAHLFVNYLLDPANAEANFSWNGYQPPIQGLDADAAIASEIVPEHLRSAVLTGTDIANGYRMLYLPPDVEAMYNSAWSSFTAGT
jgi:spermidine/putrescine transport system substrate-binding protein